MSELKTVEYFKENYFACNRDCDLNNLFKDLKQEAIKHIKYYDSLRIKLNNILQPAKINNVVLEGKKQALKDFFKITNEDLK